MKPTGPRLDRHGFPISPGFDEAGVSDPGQGGGWNLGWVRGLLKIAVIGFVLTALWLHFDVGSKLGAVLGQYHAQQAQSLALRNETEQALEQIGRALEWSPDEIRYLLFRAALHSEQRDYEQGLADVTRALELKPNDERGLSMRSSLLHFLKQHREGAAAAADMLERGIGNRAQALNTRAYSRALGNFELEEALADIDEALAQSGGDNSSYIDTRAYVLFKLGRYKEALADMDRAIPLVEKERDAMERSMKGRQLNALGTVEYKQRLQAVDENLAVMHYHRGEIHEKLGNAAEAKKDMFIGKQLGYDPSAGIY